MEEEIQQLRAQLAEAERRRAEEQRGREEEQRRREEAELTAASAVNQDLTGFLEGCHQLSGKIKPVTEASASTGGSTTNPTRRLFPRRILPWLEFATRQQDFWKQAAANPSLWTERSYPSANDLRYDERRIEPISSEDELRFIARLIVEDKVQSILNGFGANNEVDDGLGSLGSISFENQARFRADEVNSLHRTMQELSVDDEHTLPPRNSRADQFCVVRRRDGIARPVVAIEYKAPHKLTIDEICVGLKAEIWPERDVIDKHDDNIDFLCKNLMAAVVTQLFSYMIDKGVRYGYICTGEAFVFVRILDDPSTVYYSVNIPNLDYTADDESRLQRTAVSQVVAFIHQALQDEQPDQSWIQDARRKLGRWPIEVIDVLRGIPETLRKTRDASVYQPSPWVRSTKRSPIVLRRRCEPARTTPRAEEEDSDSNDGDGYAQSPMQYRQTRSRAAAARQARVDGKGTSRSDQGRDAQGTSNKSTAIIEQRPYCTRQCLLGLSTGDPLDPLCPNATLHGQNHLPHADFLRLLTEQLTFDEQQDVDCCALYVHGARAALLKVRLTAHGYTLVAKGVETTSRKYLQHEARIYHRLHHVQGRHVPVYCGRLDLSVPFYYDGVDLKHLLLMSWEGESLEALMRQGAAAQVPNRCIDLAIEALKAIHSQQVLHHDAFLRNIMYDKVAGTVSIVDFERSESFETRACRQILGEMSPNRKRKRARRASKTKVASPERFAEELRCFQDRMQKALHCT